MKLLLSVLLLVGLGVDVLPAQTPPKRASARFQQAFSVRSLDGNRVFCAIDNVGELCSDVGEFFGAGFWPKGAPNQYIFLSGLQIAGTIPASAGGGKASFPWAGDTTGAYFADFRGTQSHGADLTKVFSSRDTADLRLWPNGGVTRDAGLFDIHVLGRLAVSDEDLWARYWDGNPSYLSGRTHPMGIVVDQRAMAFNSPRGNDDIIYFVFTLYNVTARDPATYTALDPALRSEITALGARFQDSVEARLSVSIPDGGYRLDSLYVGLAMDADVGDAGQNYSNVILPFDLGVAYKSDFREPGWEFPLELFGPPFAKAPGLLGTRFLKSPAPPLALFSNTLNSATAFPDAVGVKQLWRYLSGNTDSLYGDPTCSFGSGQQARRWCYLAQVAVDTRYFQSTGPFSLDPGESKTLVLAYLFAAPTPAVVPFIGGDFKPGFPAPGDSIAADSTRIRDLERAAGWVTQSDANGNGSIETNEVTTVPRSLLDKARVAQAFVDHKFLLPQAPAAPAFFLIPGDNQVTVVWQKSASETSGDPYFTVAADPTSALYDPNFRQQDVEGYRVYRGRDPRSLQLVAQFDHGGVLLDYTGSFLYSGDCAPEFGLLTDCPDFTNGVAHRAVGAIQVPLGGRMVVNGSVFIVRTDTAVSGGNSGFPNYGGDVGWVFVDLGVRNSFSYVYAVTAFDVNSIMSGPSSLESPRLVKGVTPRSPSGQETIGSVGSLTLLAADGRVLDTAAIPTLDSVTGMFSGPMPATNGLEVALTAFVPAMLGDSSLTIRIDSIVPGDALNQRSAVYYIGVQGTGPATTLVVPLPLDYFNNERSAFGEAPAIAADSGQASRFGADSSFHLYARATIYHPGTWLLASWGRGDANAAPPNSAQTGPRWWAGSANENTAAPNELQCTPASGACIQPDLTRNAGRLSGVNILFNIQSYTTVPNVPMRELEGIEASVARAADFRLYWGAGGRVDSVIDVTHGVPMSFQPSIGPSWGVLTDSSFAIGGTDPATTADLNNTLLTWSDVFCVAPVPAYLNQCGGGGQNPARLQNHARLSPVAAISATYAGTSTLTTTGNGFILYLNGHFFLMQLPTLPTAGTVWNARFFSGSITGTAAGRDYAFLPAIRPPAVPGLRARIAFTGSRLDPTRTADSLLARVHSVPDPYYITDPLETGPLDKALRFVHLPAQAIVRIYSTSGILVQALIHNDPTGGGEETWDLRSRNGRFVASGVYFFHVETPDGRRHVGRMTIVTFRPAGAR